MMDQEGAATAALTEGEQNRLIIENTGLVARIAAHYRGQKGIPFEDLEAEGILGLVQAARNFDPGWAVKFSSFATHRVRGAIKNLIDRWREFERLDEASDQDEDRIHKWQAWSNLPFEGWSSLPTTPDELIEIFEEFSDKKEAIAAAFISLSSRERKMGQAHFFRQPRVGVGQIARDHRVSYKRAVEIIYSAVKKMRDVVKRIDDKQIRTGRTGRPRYALGRGFRSATVIPFQRLERAAYGQICRH
jgi:RNA polymerase sigma factor (sigma-70 family)